MKLIDSSYRALRSILIISTVGFLTACGGSSGGTSTGSTGGNTTEIQGIQAPSNVSVVTARNVDQVQ